MRATRELAEDDIADRGLAYIQPGAHLHLLISVKDKTLRATCVLMTGLLCVATSSAQTSTQFTSLPARSSEVPRAFTATERHIQSDPLGTLYANSAFAHGYRHGYEEGFHTGDLDVHMGRDPRLAMKEKDFGQGSREYRPTFGNKNLFLDGYLTGFRGGYADAISGAEFRASERAKKAAVGLSELLPNTRRAHFDEGLAAGYKSAQSQNAPVAHVSTEYVEQYCRRTFDHLYSLEYCSGYSRGYVLGITAESPNSMAKSQVPAR